MHSFEPTKQAAYSMSDKPAYPTATWVPILNAHETSSDSAFVPSNCETIKMPIWPA